MHTIPPTHAADRLPVSVFSHTVCQLGEGPGYDRDTGVVHWLDIVGYRLLEKHWPDGETIVHDLTEMASAMARVDGESQLLVTETGLHLRERASGRLQRLVPVEADDPLTRSNDARVHPSGALWFGTMGKQAETGAGSIYWYRAGELVRLYERISIPNSICFSPDGDFAFFADTAEGVLYRVGCDRVSGRPVGEAVPFFDTRGGEGGLDGSVVDAAGNLWNARWGGARIDVYDIDGKPRDSIALPVAQPSCPAFVGPDADRILVTSAWEGLSRRGELDGRTLMLDVEVAGLHDAAVAL